MAVETGRVPDASNAPLPADTSRKEIRLLRETRSVLEYLYQHPLALIFTGKGQPHSFPKIAVLGNVNQIGADGRAGLEPTGRYNIICAVVVNAPGTK